MGPLEMGAWLPAGRTWEFLRTCHWGKKKSSHAFNLRNDSGRFGMIRADSGPRAFHGHERHQNHFIQVPNRLGWVPTNFEKSYFSYRTFLFSLKTREPPKNTGGLAGAFPEDTRRYYFQNTPLPPLSVWGQRFKVLSIEY